LPLDIRGIDYDDPAAAVLRHELDVEMGALYGDTREGRDPAMGELVRVALTVHPEEMVATVGAYDGHVLVGHAALRPFEDALEVKRVIVRADHRGQGISKMLMLELEAIARKRGATSLILQTGNLQTEAIALYTKIGYLPIDRFGAYEPIPFFLCFGKRLDVR
jgi:ribosomal protein S18 acetylase RimI-like enzyme